MSQSQTSPCAPLEHDHLHPGQSTRVSACAHQASPATACTAEEREWAGQMERDKEGENVRKIPKVITQKYSILNTHDVIHCVYIHTYNVVYVHMYLSSVKS